MRTPLCSLLLTMVLASAMATACSGTSSSTPGNAKDDPPASASTEAGSTGSASSGPVSITVNLDSVAIVVCDDVPQRMSADAEMYTDQSYTCTHGTEQVRIDFYRSDAQQATAKQAVLDFYASSGDTRTLADLPFGCGARWAFGVDFNTTRDALLVALTQAGIEATLC